MRSQTMAERHVEARREKGYSQKQLAALADCSQSAVASIENGRNEGSALIPRLAAVMGVRALWLAEGVGEKYERESFAPLIAPRLARMAEKLAQLPDHKLAALSVLLEIDEVDREDVIASPSVRPRL